MQTHTPEKIGETMERVILRVDYRDTTGMQLADATTLAKLPDTIAEIRKENGTIVGVRHLEDAP
jgi:hypothetical protein